MSLSLSIYLRPHLKAATRRRHIHLNDIADTQVIQLAQTWNESAAAGRSAPSVFDALVKAYGTVNAKLCLRKIERLVARELLQYTESPRCAWPTDEGLNRLYDRALEVDEAVAAKRLRTS